MSRVGKIANVHYTEEEVWGIVTRDWFKFIIVKSVNDDRFFVVPIDETDSEIVFETQRFIEIDRRVNVSHR